jgi:ornithine cyclodeaminase
MSTPFSATLLSQFTRSTALQTQFLSVQDVVQLVQTAGLPNTFARMVQALREDFARWPEFDKTARTAAHSKDGVIELMPIADAQQFTFKYVNGHPKNPQRGLSTVMAFGVLADVATGMPLLISELTLTTAIRTAATSAFAAQLLARKNSRSMALIGNGAQSEFQALAFHHLLGINEIRLFDTDSQATIKLMRNLQANPDTKGLKLIACTNARQAVARADIITTVTADKQNAAVITADMIEPGMHINAVGGDCPGKTEVPSEVLALACVFVEYEPQTRIEGDLQHMPADFAVTELWRVLIGQAAGRTSEQEITMFDSVGFALEDFSALRTLRAMAQEQSSGHTLDLIPQLSDPKDLYELIAHSTSPVQHLQRVQAQEVFTESLAAQV